MLVPQPVRSELEQSQLEKGGGEYNVPEEQGQSAGGDFCLNFNGRFAFVSALPGLQLPDPQPREVARMPKCS